MDLTDSKLMQDHDSQREVNPIGNVFGTTDLHCHILSFVDIPSLIQSELVNKEWNLHANNPICVSQLNFKYCYNHGGFNQTYFTHGKNTAGKKIQQIARGVLSSAKYFVNFPKEYDTNDINNKEYMSNVSVTRFRQAESLTFDISDKLNEGLKSIKFHDQQISHRKNEQHRLLNQIGHKFKAVKKINIRFDEKRESTCFDLLKQILIANRTNIKHVKLVCTNGVCHYDLLLSKDHEGGYPYDPKKRMPHQQQCPEKLDKIQAMACDVDYGNQLTSFEIRWMLLLNKIQCNDLSRLKILRLIQVSYLIVISLVFFSVLFFCEHIQTTAG